MNAILRAKPLLRRSMPGVAFEAARRVSHLRPAHRKWKRERGMVDARREQLTSELIPLFPDLRVQAGPFTGLALQRDQVWGHDLVATLAGTYEREIHSVIEEFVAWGPDYVVDVGCANGYYVVGFAMRVPEIQVCGFDIDPQAQAATQSLAELNGVRDRVSARGACEEGDLLGLPPRSLVVMDCEGAEIDMLTDRVVAQNRSTAFIIECHDVFDPRISKILVKRFRGRDVQLISGQRRLANDAPMLPQELAEEAIDESRGVDGVWLVVRPGD